MYFSEMTGQLLDGNRLVRRGDCFKDWADHKWIVYGYGPKHVALYDDNGIGTMRLSFLEFHHFQATGHQLPEHVIKNRHRACGWNKGKSND